MAADIAQLSDSELRQKLMARGASVGPITDSTRKLYLKKYMQLENGAKSASKVTRSKSDAKVQLGFSSDEDDNVAKGKFTPRKSNRKSISRSDQTLRSFDDSANNASFKVPQVTSRRSTRRSTLNTSNGELTQHNVSKNNSPNNSAYYMQVSDSENEYNETNKPASNVVKRKSIRNSLPSKKTSAAANENKPSLDTPPSNATQSNHSSPRTSTPIKRFNSVYNNIEKPPGFVYPSLNYLRLNSARDRTTDPTLNGHKGKSSHDEERFSNDDSCCSTSSNWPHRISSMFLLIAVIFFIAVSLVYVIGTKQWTLADIMKMGAQQKTQLINHGDFSNVNGICDDADCVKPANAKQAINCCHQLFEHLSLIAGKFECNEDVDQVKSDKLSKVQAVQFVSSFTSIGTTKLFNDALILFMKNDWGVTLTNDEGESKLYFPEEVRWLQSNHAVKSLKCRLSYAIYNVLSKIIGFIIAVLAVFAMYKIFKYHKQTKQEYKRKVYALAEQIIGILKTYHNECKAEEDGADRFIAVPHVRDMIIPLHKRGEMSQVWEDACKLIEDNESRVRIEYQQVGGEDNKVWRWLPNCSPADSNRKVWQGRAFESDTKSLNGLSYGATPCLKIRNMFKSEDGQQMTEECKTSITDAVIEKCLDDHQIVHIAIANANSREGCVYVQFCNSQAALAAYNRLHGWWFDGNLVTVKFIRLERYHEHYPESEALQMPVKPSNDLKLSLSHQQQQFLSTELIERS